jgi:predicted methyltransferase
MICCCSRTGAVRVVGSGYPSLRTHNRQEEMLKHRILACLLTLSAIAATPPAISQTAPDYAAIVAAPDRSSADRKLDTNRAPAQWLAFIGAKPGLKILDIFAVYGWKAELLARAVAPGGKVYAQNSEAVFARVKDRLDARLKTPAATNIVAVVRPFEDPAPPGMHDFNLVTFFYAYHDVTYLGVDRAKMVKAFYDALKPGGELVVGDYSAKPGAGTSVVKTLHRSDEALVTSEIEAGGFKLVDHGDFLRLPGDARETPSHSSAQPVDIYVLKFRKPG